MTNYLLHEGQRIFRASTIGSQTLWSVSVGRLCSLVDYAGKWHIAEQNETDAFIEPETMTCGGTKIPVIPQVKHNKKEGKARNLDNA